FFSSRRRHTRCLSDWSSDVCSSDLSVGLARVWSARSTDQRQCNWLAPAKRRVAGIGGVIPRPEESLPRAPVLAVPLPWAPGRFCPRLNAYVTADSKQNIWSISLIYASTCRRPQR